MGHRSNQPITGRDFFFSTSGKNSLSGTSDENPVADPTQAITNVTALDPPPNSTNPASINASVSGTYDAGLAIPQFVTCNSSSASILTTDAVNVECLGRHTVEWGSLLNFSNNGICVKIDGQTRVAVNINAVVSLGEDGIGFSISGVCEEVFVDVKLGDIEGVRGIMFDHTANSAVPIEYKADTISFMGDDQTVIRYNDPVATTESIFNISAAQSKGITTNSTFLELIAGLVVVDVEVLLVDTIAVVNSGARLGLDCIAAVGDTIIEAGGIASYKSIGELVGDVDVSGGFALTTNSMTGDLTVTGTGNALVNIDTMTGDITVETGGILFIDCDVYTGTIIEDGTINGWINGEPYGTAQEQLILRGADFTNQIPTGTDAPMQIKFGGAQLGSSDPVELAADGTLTINKKKKYKIDVVLEYGRNNAGAAAWMFFRTLKNGTQIGGSIFAKIDNPNNDLPVFFSRRYDLAVGDVLTFEFVRDSQGFDDGSLFAETPTLGDWNQSASAVLAVSI